MGHQRRDPPDAGPDRNGPDGEGPSWDLRIENVHLATMVSGSGPWGAVPDGVLGIVGDRLAWVGPAAEVPAAARARATVDAGGRWATPGLVDCHTHLVFAGDRVAEWEARLGGATYEELARAGGGILSTVRATRAADPEELVAAARPRLAGLAREGVTTVEIKSGYGLDTATELRMLEVAGRVAEAEGVRLRRTLLGAHALPPRFADDRAGYVDLVCHEMIPEAASRGIADAVDAFCEEVAFTPDECARVFEAAEARGLDRRLHADQRTDSGGAALAAEWRARSADHLEHASLRGVEAMAAAGTRAVLLPGAAYFLRDPTVPPVEAFRSAGVPMAVATDLNPGSSPLGSPLLAMSMACTLFGTTPEESLAGTTRVAADVLGLSGEVGTLEVGKVADVALWEVASPAELAYWIGGRPDPLVVRGGRLPE